jgi:hypothetical protein
MGVLPVPPAKLFPAPPPPDPPERPIAVTLDNPPPPPPELLIPNADDVVPLLLYGVPDVDDPPAPTVMTYDSPA